MNLNRLYKILSALLCVVLLAGCAALAEDIPMEAPFEEVELTLGAEDAGEQAVAAEPMDAEAPAEPTAVAAPVEPKEASPFQLSAKASATVNVGDELSLIPDTDGVLFTAWKSSKPMVAAVNDSGIVTAISKGKAKITATTNLKKKYTLTLTVVDPYEPSGISFAEGKTASMTIAAAMQLNAVLAPASAQSALTWKSSKPKVATVDANGLVTPVAEGTTKITATTYNKKKATITVKVVDPFKPGAVKITEGTTATTTIIQSLQLHAELEPLTAMSILTWKSSKPKVATVDDNGFVTPLSEGKTKITVTTSNKKKATITVTVTDPYKPGGVSFAEGKSLAMTAGQTLQLNPVLEPATAIATLTWKSSKPKVAAVDGNGVVTAVAKGTAKITVQAANNKKAKATITITVAAGEAPAPVTDSKDLSAWLGKPATEAESALGLARGTDTNNTGTYYKLAGSGFYMYLSSSDYASATINWVAIEGQGKSDLNICGFNVNGMTYDQAVEKAKADKWTIKNNDDFGNFRALVLTKNGKWLRVTDNRSRLVSQVAYANAN